MISSSELQHDTNYLYLHMPVQETAVQEETYQKDTVVFQGKVEQRKREILPFAVTKRGDTTLILKINRCAAG